MDTVVSLVANQVVRHPSAPAVIQGDRVVSYGELWGFAGGVARLLAAHGIGERSVVGLWCGRGVVAIAAMLGTLYLGATFLPLDDSEPEVRRTRILSDACPDVLLVDEQRASQNGVVPEVLVDEFIASSAMEAYARPSAARPETPMYVMYTSGSTGVPKGVIIKHSSVVNLIREPRLDLTPGRIVAHIASQAFDASTFEIWGPLCTGGTIVVLEPTQLLDSRLLSHALAQYGVDTMFVTTALFNYLAEERPPAFRGLRTLVFGGERGSEQHAESMLDLLQGTAARLLHAYGPTENTVFSTLELLDPATTYAELPIGTPLRGIRAYLLDADGEVRTLEDGEGELLLAGRGLALGYLNYPELTTEKFVSVRTNETVEKVYKTGDMCRYYDGKLIFKERRDGMVKLRGHRIELGEIEGVLQKHPCVLAAVVVLAGSQVNPRLIGFVRLAEHADSEELRRYIGNQLPPYMTPQQVVPVSHFPVTPSGKIDRQALVASLQSTL